MSIVEGVIQPGEATRAALKFCRRQNGFNWPLYAFFVGLLLTPILFGIAYDFAADWWKWWRGYEVGACAAGFVIGVLLLRPVYLRATNKRFRRRRTALGLPDALPTRIWSAEDALHYDCAGSSSQIAWAVVTEIIPIDAYWVITANSNPYYVPRRFFADAQAEWTFVADVLRRMSPPAQARSQAAAAFSKAG